MKTLLALIPTAAALAAAAPAGAASPALSISASPFSLSLQGAATGAIHVTNPGSSAVTVEVATGDLAVSQTGEVSVDPKKRPKLSARAWLTVTPARLSLGPGGSADVVVVTHPPGTAAPGDHYALVLLTTVPPQGAQVGVSTRLGVSVIDTVAGGRLRAPAIARPAALKKGKARFLRIRIANHGDRIERLAKGQISVVVERGKRTLARLRGPARVLLPHAQGVLALRYPARLHGGTYLVLVRAGTTVARFRMRL